MSYYKGIFAAAEKAKGMAGSSAVPGKKEYMDDFRLREIYDIEAYVRRMRQERPERIRNFERLGMNMKDVNDIELFSLIQAVGLVEALQRGSMTTCDTMQSVFSLRTIREFKENGMDGKLVSLLLDGMELQDENGHLTEEVIEKSSEIRDRALEMIKEVLARRRDCINLSEQQKLEQKLEEEVRLMKAGLPRID